MFLSFCGFLATEKILCGFAKSFMMTVKRACYLKRNQLLWAFFQRFPVFFFVAPDQGLSMERPSKPGLFSEAGVAT